MSQSSEVFQKRLQYRIEQHIKANCLHRIVKNDGVEIGRLFETLHSITEVKHNGNFVFEVRAPKFNLVLVWTEPMDEDGMYIRIIGYRIP